MLWRSRSVTRGFTLIELLIVITIIGSLMAMLLPAINAVKNAMRRAACGNNMRQIAIALNTYATAHTINSDPAYPPGVPVCTTAPTPGSTVNVDNTAICLGPNWLSAIMYQLDDKPNYDDLMTCLDQTWNAFGDCAKPGGTSPTNWLGVGNKPLQVAMCPASPSNMPATKLNGMTTSYARTNFAGCWGMDVYINSDDTSPRADFNNKTLTATKKDGIFGHVTTDATTTTKNDTNFKKKGKKLAHNKGTASALIKDGVGKTIMISEVVPPESDTDNRGVWVFGGMGGASFTGKYPPNSTTPDQIPFCDTTIADPKLLCTQNKNTNAFASARSGHGGSVNVAMADANTRNIDDTVDPTVWQNLCTKNTGINVDLP